MLFQTRMLFLNLKSLILVVFKQPLLEERKPSIFTKFNNKEESKEDYRNHEFESSSELDIEAVSFTICIIFKENLGNFA